MDFLLSKYLVSHQVSSLQDSQLWDEEKRKDIVELLISSNAYELVNCWSKCEENSLRFI